MKEKRKVSANLGRTQHFQADELYKDIAKRIGPFRRCPFYNGAKYSQFQKDEHDRLNPDFPNPNVPIEQYDFARNALTRVWGLQAYCKVCYKAYRDARIGKARSTWFTPSGKAMTDDQIREWYRKKVAPTMRCSNPDCKRSLDPSEFPISRSMEKGLHNECYECVKATAASVREQMWLSDGDWGSWKKAVTAMRDKETVACAGWPRSQNMGFCKGSDAGKKMHADHMVPLRAGGMNDAKNFQPLCNPCNIRKSDQLDPRLSSAEIVRLTSRLFRHLIEESDSIPTIERKLKSGLFDRISRLIKVGLYLEAIRAKKKEVNGQWIVERAYKKGVDWVKRGGGKVSEDD